MLALLSGRMEAADWLWPADSCPDLLRVVAFWFRLRSLLRLLPGACERMWRLPWEKLGFSTSRLRTILSDTLTKQVSADVHLPAGSGRCTAFAPGRRLSATPLASLLVCPASGGKAVGRPSLMLRRRNALIRAVLHRRLGVVSSTGLRPTGTFAGSAPLSFLLAF